MLHSKQLRNRNLQRTSPAHCYARGHWSPSCKQPPPPPPLLVYFPVMTADEAEEHDRLCMCSDAVSVHVTRHRSPLNDSHRVTFGGCRTQTPRVTIKPHCWCDVYLYYCLQGMMLRLHDVRTTWDAAHVIEDAHPTCVKPTWIFE